MHDPTPLPPELPADGFGVGEATNAGVTRRRLRAGDLDRTYWGLRSVSAPEGVSARCRLLAIRMPPQAFFSHSTAAQLFGIPLPWRLARESEIHVSMPRPARAPHATGIIGHRSSAEEDEIVRLGDLRTTSPARTWSDLAEILPLIDLVAAGDHLLQASRPLTTRAHLDAILRSRTSRRGLRTLHDALGLLDPFSESPAESRLRALVVLGGFETPEVNRVVTDRFGEFVARTDLYLVRHNLVLEYMGDYHRTTKGQWRADLTRRSRLEATGRRVMELGADDLRDPVELLQRIRRRAALRY